LVYRGPVFCSLILTALTALSGAADDYFSCTRTTLQLFLDVITYSRLPFSCRLPFRSTTDYLTHGNTLIYLYLDLQSESNHLFLHLVFDPSCATDIHVLREEARKDVIRCVVVKRCIHSSMCYVVTWIEEETGNTREELLEEAAPIKAEGLSVH
jgi:hypothetical protein